MKLLVTALAGFGLLFYLAVLGVIGLSLLFGPIGAVAALIALAIIGAQNARR